MPHWPWFDCRGWSARPPAASLYAGLCVVALGCLPERELASYADALPNDPRPSGDESADEPDVGLVAVRVSPPLTDAAPHTADAGVDGGQAPSFACRAECQCEALEGQMFMFCGTPVTQVVAAARCLEAGAALVSIEDATLNTWLSQRMATAANDDYWTSGTDAETEGVWRWGGGGPVFDDFTGDAAGLSGFSPWDDNQPNDLDGEDCLRSIGGLWRDLDCGGEIPYACEG